MTTASTSTPSSQRSPLRCLLHAARKGRRRWKQKAQLRNQQLKVLKVRVRDLELSRQQHAQNAQHAQNELAQAQQTIAQLQNDLAQLKAQYQELEKKTTHQTDRLPKADNTMSP